MRCMTYSKRNILGQGVIKKAKIKNTVQPFLFMRIQRSTILLLLITLVLFSCKQNRRTMLIGTWHAVSLDNPDMDSFFTRSQQYIDTIGKANDTATNRRLYGVTNMDSMRHILQGQYDSAKAMQRDAVNNTVFRFRKDSMVILSFNGSIDSSRWYINDSGALILDELNGYGPGDRVKMQIEALTDTVLKLKFSENGAISTVTFRKNP